MSFRKENVSQVSVKILEEKQEQEFFTSNQEQGD